MGGTALPNPITIVDDLLTGLTGGSPADKDKPVDLAGPRKAEEAYKKKKAAEALSQEEILSATQAGGAVGGSGQRLLLGGLDEKVNKGRTSFIKPR